ncbi:MAG: PH domain-containing protein [Longimonas sp.]|uniref:PH domain-containing protein n=1 Tax=Longimonas sp. TaxID=2039626 RepID=UPI00334478B3
MDLPSTLSSPGVSPRALLPSSSLTALDPDIRSVWRIKLCLLHTVIFLGILFYAVTRFFSGTDWTMLLGIVTGVLICMVLYILVWPRWRYDAWGYELHEDELVLEYGVITHVRTVVPLRRIQHLDVSQDIFEREFDLGRLIIHTAGTRSSDVVIPGLPLSTAERIRDEVKQYILNDPLTEDVL